MFGPQDVAIIGVLIFLEGILSIDNAVVLAMLVKPLPKHLQKRALTWGIVGAIAFRILAVSMASQLIEWRWVKYLGGGYLVYLALHHFITVARHKNSKNPKPAKARSFWKTVLVIELTDIAFAIDSILAAVALTPKVQLVVIGGILGMILMRYGATIFVSLLEKFPRFETSAYLLVFLIGTKLILEAVRLPWADFHSASQPGFWGFWGTMLLCIAYGFRRDPKSRAKR